MCGIAGIFTSDGTPEAELLEATRRMASTLSHRGPDDAGAYVDGTNGLGLGFRRLAIFDLSKAGHQPMDSPNGRFVGVFNGEVYNHPELRRELKTRGFSFRGESDTEVLLAAVEQWGLRSALQRCIGMFALALWDRRERELLLARDRIGIKPLYLYQEPERVAFSSELKALVRLDEFDPTLDPRSVAVFLRHLYVPAPATIFSGVREIEPGTITRFSAPSSTPTVERYWDLRQVAQAGFDHPSVTSEAEASRRAWSLFKDSVRLRLRSHVPLGILLSGGLDSSLLGIACCELGGDPPRSFTVSFDVESHDEASHASEVSNRLGFDHTVLRVTGEDALNLVSDLPRLFDEPHANPSQIPTHLICKKAQESVTVALAGDGADEIFGGYNRYIYGRDLIPILSSVPKPLRRGLTRSLDVLSLDAWDSLGEKISSSKIRLLDSRLLGSKIWKFQAMGRADTPAEMYRELLSSGLGLDSSLIGAGDDAYPVLASTGWGQGRARLLRAMMLSDQCYYLPGDLLAKVDRASMAVGLEVRVPFLDHRLVEYSWQLPTSLLVRNRSGKWLMRRIAQEKLGPLVTERSKIGFTVPIDRWLRGPLRTWCLDNLRSHGTCGGLIDEEFIWQTWNRFEQGRSEYALTLWALATLAAWTEHWIAPRSH